MKPTPMYILTSKSDNHKTGKMAVSTSPKATCPEACPFHGNGCYAASGPLAIWWNRCSKSKKDGEDAWKDFCKRVQALPKGTVLRHNQAGDLVPEPDCADKIDAQAATDLVTACILNDIKGYTYTHYPVLNENGYAPGIIDNNRTVIEDMNAAGFIVNISANSPAHADAILDSGLRAPVTTLIKSGTKERRMKTPMGRPIVVCPAMWKQGMTCLKCKSCMVANRDVVIAFPSHGTCKKRSDVVIDRYEELYTQKGD